MTTFDSEPSMIPVKLGDGFGLLHHAASARHGGTGVVLCSAWGIHELSSRKMFFQIASRLAAAGMSTIRFDYPGTADAIAAPADGLEAWIGAALGAANRLKEACGLDRIVFAGVGIGATIAMLASARRQDVEGLVLAAPVISGRRYLREIALAANVVDEGLGLNADQRPAGVSIGGINMPVAVAAELKTIDLMTTEFGTPLPALVIGRPSQPQDTALADLLARRGAKVDRADFDRYDEVMDNPTLAIQPEEMIETIVRWCRDLTATSPGVASHSVAPPERIMTEGEGHCEEPIIFGHGLFGVLTHPVHRAASPIVVFLNSGYDHHSGWAYQWTRSAQVLADSGVASLRFDMGNIGDSRLRTGARSQVLYDDGQQADIQSAIDMLAQRGETSIVIVGRCSGAFAALHATRRDSRITGSVIINPLRFIWDAGEDVEVAIRVGPRSIATYRHLAVSARTFERILAGEVDVIGVAKSLGTQFYRRLVNRVAPVMGSLSKVTRLRRQCRAMMDDINARGTAIRFICSERDVSLEQMAFYFGRDFRGLRRFKDASLTRLQDADHNITPAAAHEAVVNVIRETALKLPVPVLQSLQTTSKVESAGHYPLAAQRARA
jgi:dienelactone hydrolase